MINSRITIWVMVVVLVANSLSKADLIGYTANETGNSIVYLTDFDTGEQTVIGMPSGIDTITALEVSPVNGRLYAINLHENLYEINISTGVGTLLGNLNALGSGLHSLMFAPNGTLYGLSNWNDNGLFEINTSTAETTLIGSLNPFISVTALAIDNGGRAIGYDSGADWLFEIDLTDGSTTSLGQLDGDFFAFDYGPDGTLYALDYHSD
ncbi:MAG TPA: DUF4394 domain-containing protein, partial [bacterium]|nr:DUF4394 domain-containing protein [bacterium]